MTACANRHSETEAAVLALTVKDDPQFAELARTLGEEKATWQRISTRFGEWDVLDETARE